MGNNDLYLEAIEARRIGDKKKDDIVYLIESIPHHFKRLEIGLSYYFGKNAFEMASHDDRLSELIETAKVESGLSSGNMSFAALCNWRNFERHMREVVASNAYAVADHIYMALIFSSELTKVIDCRLTNPDAVETVKQLSKLEQSSQKLIKYEHGTLKRVGATLDFSAEIPDRSWVTKKHWFDPNKPTFKTYFSQAREELSDKVGGTTLIQDYSSNRNSLRAYLEENMPRYKGILTLIHKLEQVTL